MKCAKCKDKGYVSMFNISSNKFCECEIGQELKKNYEKIVDMADSQDADGELKDLIRLIKDHEIECKDILNNQLKIIAEKRIRDLINKIDVMFIGTDTISDYFYYDPHDKYYKVTYSFSKRKIIELC